MVSHLGSPNIARLLVVRAGESTKHRTKPDEVSLWRKEQRKLSSKLCTERLPRMLEPEPGHSEPTAEAPHPARGA